LPANDWKPPRHTPRAARLLSWTGVFLCLGYTIFVAVSILIAYSTDGDDKGWFVFMQLPLSPQLALLQELGLSSLLEGPSWFEGYIYVGGLTYAVLYFLGWLIGRAFQRIF
jgi:hypothetical protein